MKRQQSSSRFVVEDDIPRAYVGHKISFADFADLSEDRSPAAKYEQFVWKVASVLFDTRETGDGSQIKNILPKAPLSRLWGEAVEEATMQHERRATSAEEKAVIRLAGHKIDEAVETLLNNNNYRLGTLISQLGGGVDVHEDIINQLHEWRLTNAISEISTPVRTLYELAAGNTCISKGKSNAGPENRVETFNISKKFDLDWKRSFGLRLWYGNPDAEPLAKTVESYAADLASGREEVRPSPWFVETNADLGWRDSNPQQRQDILWGLLQIFAANDSPNLLQPNLSDLLSPANTTGNPLDARLSFQLYQLLSTRGLADFPPPQRAHLADSLTTNTLYQLASTPAHLCSAVFVALHLSSPTTRRKTIQSLLNRHAASIGDSPTTSQTYTTLTTHLHIPDPWLWLAKAHHASTTLNDPDLQTRYLLRAGPESFQDAHHILSTLVAPRAVIEETTPALAELLAAFRAAGAHRIPAWSAAGGAGMYDDYARLLALDDAAAEREGLLRALAAALPAARAPGRVKGLEERAAVEEMQRVVATGIKALERAGGGGLPSGVGEVGEDGVLGGALGLCDGYYRLMMAA